MAESGLYGNSALSMWEPRGEPRDSQTLVPGRAPPRSDGMLVSWRLESLLCHPLAV